MKRGLWILLLSITLYFAARAPASEPPAFVANEKVAPVDQPTKAGNIIRLDPRIDKLIATDAKLEKVADGFDWVEGPVWNRQENYLLFSNIPANAIIKWQADKPTEIFMKPSGYTGSAPFAGREPGTNGLTYDNDGHLVMCEHGDRRITRLESNGKKTTLADRFDGKRLNSPNDLVFSAKGDLYFTDPPWGLPKTFDDPQKALDFCGVYRLSKTGKLTLLTKELKAPNGIALSPDEKKLYVTESLGERAAWYVFDVKEDGTITNGRIFFDAAALMKIRKGAPDGLKVDKDGNLFSAGPEGIYVFAPDGTLLGTIETGVPTGNCNWGEDGSALFITADKAIYRIKTTTRGKGF
ncbi:MAG: SMP-30/gluconolactonase/LRE family protein [Acidobacteriota bacterium]